MLLGGKRMLIDSELLIKELNALEREYSGNELVQYTMKGLLASITIFKDMIRRVEANMILLNARDLEGLKNK